MVLSTPARSPRISLIALFLLWISVPLSSLLVLTDLAYSSQPTQVGFGVTVIPSSVVIRVGEKARINVTVTNAETAPAGQTCFSLEGFPDSGFRTSFVPECATFQLGKITATLTVEATPAAAPQSFAAFVIARSGGQTSKATLDVAVEPAFPPWIAWVGLLLFLLIFGIAIMGKPKLSIRSIRRKRTSQRETRIDSHGLTHN